MEIIESITDPHFNSSNSAFVTLYKIQDIYSIVRTIGTEKLECYQNQNE